VLKTGFTPLFFWGKPSLGERFNFLAEGFKLYFPKVWGILTGVSNSGTNGGHLSGEKGAQK